MLKTVGKRYISRATLALEKKVSENALLRKENTEQRELLETRKKRKRGKRVAIEGRFILNYEEIVKVVRKAGAEAGEKRPAKRQRKGLVIIEIRTTSRAILRVIIAKQSRIVLLLPSVYSVQIQGVRICGRNPHH
ncbi:hypothetical protein M433DRAFT_509659 [Acidomyces richmondensis BFW]|nr:MAG: hypothetical protein FE78DRAFT_317718 [Acidomyces sp. 'richmondensis']KYG47202.1 hypothetical protein M433DRAFT_509659 [Acidomyces richmondensis BFW]